MQLQQVVPLLICTTTRRLQTSHLSRCWRILRLRQPRRKLPWSALPQCNSKVSIRRSLLRMAQSEVRRLFIKSLRQWCSLPLQLWSKYSRLTRTVWKVVVMEVDTMVAVKLEAAHKSPCSITSQTWTTMTAATSRRKSLRWFSSTSGRTPWSPQISIRQARLKRRRRKYRLCQPCLRFL